MRSSTFAILSVTIAAAAISACGGSGSDSGSEPGSTNTSSFINGPLTGTLYSLDRQRKYDLATGERVSDVFSVPRNQLAMSVSHVGGLAAHDRDDCVPHSIPRGNWTADCVVLTDLEGNQISSIPTDASIRSIDLSPDGRYAAAEVAYFGEERVYGQILIADTSSGSLLSIERDRLSERNVGAFRLHWAEDGSIYYASSLERFGENSDDVLIKRIPSPLNFQLPATDEVVVDLRDFRDIFPEEGEGRIQSFDVSPDGRHVVFSWEVFNGEVGRPHALYTYDTEQRSLSLFAWVDLIPSVLRYPTFSPDGQWIIAGTDLTPSLVPGVGAISDLTVALRLNAGPHVVRPDGGPETEDNFFLRENCASDTCAAGEGSSIVERHIYIGWFDD